MNGSAPPLTATHAAAHRRRLRAASRTRRRLGRFQHLIRRDDPAPPSRQFAGKPLRCGYWWLGTVIVGHFREPET